MGNIKICKKIKIFFLFFHKKFIQIFIKSLPLGQSLIFPFNKYYNLKTIYKFYIRMKIVFVECGLTFFFFLRACFRILFLIEIVFSHYVLKI